MMMIDNHFQIGEVAETAGLSLRTIRYYEEIGLVTPSGRTEGGFRLYTKSDIERLRLVKALKPVGMSLETMRELLECVDLIRGGSTAEAGEAERRLEAAISTALDQCDQMEERLTTARQALRHLSVLTAQGAR
jgi:DNA-binding transcriptional MerR regulator